MDSWKNFKAVFFTLATPGALWLLLFFIIPLTILFAMSLGGKAVIDGQISATEFTYFTGITNYIEALNPLYMQILAKTVLISAIATVVCLLIAYPIAFGICFAPNKWKPLLLLLVVLAILDQPADTHLCIDRGIPNTGLSQPGFWSSWGLAHLKCSTTTSPSYLASFMSTCHSWCCRFMQPSSGWTSHSLRQVSTLGPRSLQPSAR